MMDRKEFLTTLGMGLASISAFSQIFSGSEELPKIEKGDIRTEVVSSEEFIEMNLGSGVRDGDLFRYLNVNDEYQHVVARKSNNGMCRLYPIDYEMLQAIKKDPELIATMLPSDQIKIGRFE